MRLSSDNLYHFTKKLDSLKGILSTGFRFSVLKEDIPADQFKRALYAVCFCDIKIDDTESHRDCYGNYAIALTKEWGISTGISPVRYVHYNSPGASKSYLKLRNYYKNMWDLQYVTSGKIDPQLFYLFLTILHTEDKLKGQNLIEEININKENFVNEYNKLENEFTEFYDNLKNINEDYAMLVTKYLSTLNFRITELHNELLERDLFLRKYNDGNKILYDEREWRAIYLETISAESSQEHEREFDLHYEQGYLPEKYNLRFTPKDVVVILTDTIEAKEELIKYLGNTDSLIDYQEKVHALCEHKESYN
jgi:hypothetical protein